jgi:hypothetical protein
MALRVLAELKGLEVASRPRRWESLLYMTSHVDHRIRCWQAVSIYRTTATVQHLLGHMCREAGWVGFVVVCDKNRI